MVSNFEVNKKDDITICVHVVYFGRQREYLSGACKHENALRLVQKASGTANTKSENPRDLSGLNCYAMMKNRGLFPDQFSIGGEINSRP